MFPFFSHSCSQNYKNLTLNMAIFEQNELRFNTETTFNTKSEKRKRPQKGIGIFRINRGSSVSEISFVLVNIKLESKIASNLRFYLLIDCKISF